jgi:putative ABC transport system permease protein
MSPNSIGSEEPMKNTALMLRWSWRDLRRHWAKVLAIALVIAIGTGAYAGLSSNANWRRASYEASYDALAMYDIRVGLPTGAFTDEGSLRAALNTVDHAAWIDAAEERLVLPTQVGTTGPNGEILVRGEITGTRFTNGGPEVNSYHAFTGRLLDERDSGADTVMLDRLFAQFYDLPDTGTIELSGGRTVDYVAQATTPEFFAVSPEGEIFLSEASFAGVHTTLATAQEIGNARGAVNDLVVTLTDGADRAVVAEEIEGAMTAAGLGVDISTRDDNTAYRTLINDVENDQRMFNALALLLFSGAVIAAYIMIHRFTQQQRREIGVAMALGVSPRKIAFRPLLVSAQIALLGVIFGIGVGMLIGQSMQSLLESFIPLPIWDTSFQTGLFAWVAAAGSLVPFLATSIPVGQAVRVKPIDAIRPLFHKAVPAGRRSRKVHAHGSTFSRMPLHNLRRSPWRSGFTMVSVALAVTVLVAFLGLVDSIFATVDTAEEEASGNVPDRVVVNLATFAPVTAPNVAAIANADSVVMAEPTLRLGGQLSAGAEAFPVILELMDLDDGLWHPSLIDGELRAEPGLVLAEEAAADLDVQVGDTVVLRHPRRTGPASVTFVESEFPVMGIHPYPIRNFAYLDASHAGLMGLNGITNMVQVLPDSTVADIDVQRELFGIPGVASVQDVSATTQHIRDQLGEFSSIIETFVVPVVLLTVLIAFLTASINLDARSREHATMFAFGVRVRTALVMAVTESTIIGAVATALGVVGGIAALEWMNRALFSSTLPDVGINVTLQVATVITVVILGVVAVAVAPLFTARRMRRMNIPGTLRLVE